MQSVSNGDSSRFVPGQRKIKTRDWSSLPDLLLWMAKDKLDALDNKSFAAVCRDWWSALNSYPKVLQSVGDGFPWITFVHMRKSLEFFSVAGERKFKVETPQFFFYSVLSSNRGWVLLHKFSVGESSHHSLILVNFFTRDSIELPPCPMTMHSTCFTTNSDGYPHRVFLLMLKERNSKAIIKTARPGDGTWTDHTLLGYQTNLSFIDHFITIGSYVYSIDSSSRIVASNLADQTWKELPPPSGTKSRSGFIVEHNGRLIFVKCVYAVNSPYKFGSFALYRYNNVTSWREMRNGEVNDTSLYYHKDRGCIAIKGKGLKIYHLVQEFTRDGTCHTWMEIYDLLNGSREIRHFNYQIYASACWVDIG